MYNFKEEIKPFSIHTHNLHFEIKWSSSEIYVPNFSHIKSLEILF